MQKSLKIFFVYSLLLMFLSNVSGFAVCVEHANHSTSKIVDKKDDKNQKDSSSYNTDDGCQCALHLQMNNYLHPEVPTVDFTPSLTNDVKLSHSKAISFYCLLDHFSSRAPPSMT